MRRLGGALAVLLAVVLLPAAPAAAQAADPSYDVPDDATLSIEGDGAGHGKGLSQYGAYSAARDGVRVDEILDFYYPGTKAGTVGGTVKVRLTADDDRDLVVDDRRGLRLRNTAGGRTWRLDRPEATRWRIRSTEPGRSVVSYRTGRWHEWRTLRADAELSAGGKPVTLRTPGARTAYRGTLRSTWSAGERVTVNVLPMEDYVRGVVPAEMAAASWPQHALRAQAVAARTYAAYERQSTANPAYDLCDTAACQAYRGATAEHDRSDTAVAKTARRVLTWKGDLAFAQYSASNGGYTVSGGDAHPYLVAEPDPYEHHSPDYYDWEEQVSSAEIEETYNLENLTGIAVETRDGNGPRGGRVETVRLHSSTGWTGTVSGDSFRRNFGLASTLFEITRVD